MKKLFAIILTAIFALGLCACDSKAMENGDKNMSSNQSSDFDMDISEPDTSINASGNNSSR